VAGIAVQRVDELHPVAAPAAGFQGGLPEIAVSRLQAGFSGHDLLPRLVYDFGFVAGHPSNPGVLAPFAVLALTPLDAARAAMIAGGVSFVK